MMIKCAASCSKGLGYRQSILMIKPLREIRGLGLSQNAGAILRKPEGNPETEPIAQTGVRIQGSYAKGNLQGKA